MTDSSKKNFLLRNIIHWPFWAVAGLISLIFYLGIWPLVFHFVIFPKAVPGKQGLQVHTFNKLEIKGKPSQSFFSTSDKLTIEKSDSSLLAYGLWNVPQTGLYRIRLECDDFGSLNLDGQDLIQLSGINALNIGETDVELEEGYHLLVLRLVNGPGQGWLTLNTISPQRKEPLLGGDSLVFLDLANLNSWIKVIKGLEKSGLVLMIFSLGILFLLFFIHSHKKIRKEIHSQGIKNIFSIFFLIVFIFLGLYYQYHLYQQSIPNQKLRYFRDQVTLFEQSLLEIKPFIPSRGTIGYFSDRDDPAVFFQAQYSLAPLLVTKDVGYNLVIGVIYDPDLLRKPDFLKKWRIIRQFRNGLVLMEKATK